MSTGDHGIPHVALVAKRLTRENPFVEHLVIGNSVSVAVSIRFHPFT